MKFKGGIYAIIVLGVGTYYGETDNLIRRWRIHRKYLNNGKHHCIKLRRAWRYLGPEAFTFVVLEQSDELDKNKQLRLLREQFYITSDPLCLNTKFSISDAITENSLPNREIYRNKSEIYLERMPKSIYANIREGKNGKLLGIEEIEGKFRMGTFSTDNECKLTRKKRKT